MPARVKTRSSRKGVDLNDVLREILQAIMQDRGLSENKLATLLGMNQRRVNAFLKGENGLQLSGLSQICAALEVTPIDLFLTHPRYGEKQAKLRVAKDALYDRFRALLTGAEARAIIQQIEGTKELGILPAVMDVINGFIEIGKAARRRALRQSRTPRRRRRVR